MDKKYEKILVAVDKTEKSKNVYKRAIGSAVANNAVLGVVLVIEMADYGTVTSLDPTVWSKVKANGSKFLKEIKQEAEAEGVKEIQIFFEKGDVKRTIVDKVAKEFKPDLIICGDRELKGYEYFMLLGSVSNYIIHKADCDVLVVKSNERKNI